MENEQIVQKIKARQHSSYWTFTILGLLLPIVGIIVGIVYLTKDDKLDKKLGEHTIAISVLGFILYFVFISFVNMKPIVDTRSSIETPSYESLKSTPEPVSKAAVSVVSSKQKNTSYGSVSIVGEVINNGEDAANYVKVTATFYDTNNEVVDTSFTYAGDTADTGLQKSKTAPFEIHLLNKTKFDHYKLDVSWD
jgi:hypothetical protein